MTDITSIDLGFSSNDATGDMTGIVVKDVLTMVRNILAADSFVLIEDEVVRLEELSLFNTEEFEQQAQYDANRAYRSPAEMGSYASRDSADSLTNPCMGTPLLPTTDIGSYLHHNWRCDKYPDKMNCRPLRYTATRNGEEVMQVRVICGSGEDSDEEFDEEEKPQHFDSEWRLSEYDPLSGLVPPMVQKPDHLLVPEPEPELERPQRSNLTKKLLPSLDIRGMISRTLSKNSEHSSSKNSGSGNGNSPLPNLASSPLSASTSPHDNVFSPRGPGSGFGPTASLPMPMNSSASASFNSRENCFSPRDTITRLGTEPMLIPDASPAGSESKVSVAPRVESLASSRSASGRNRGASDSRSPPLRSDSGSGKHSPHGIVLTVQYQPTGCNWWKVGLSLDANNVIYSNTSTSNTVRLTKKYVHLDADSGVGGVSFSASTIGSLSMSEGTKGGTSTSISSHSSIPTRTGSAGLNVGSEGSGKGSTPSSFSKRIGAYFQGQALPTLRSRQSTPAPNSSASSYNSKASSLGNSNHGNIHANLSVNLSSVSGSAPSEDMGVQSPRQGILSPLSGSPNRAAGPVTVTVSSSPGTPTSRSLPSNYNSPPPFNFGYSTGELQGYLSSTGKSNNQSSRSIAEEEEDGVRPSPPASMWGTRKDSALKFIDNMFSPPSARHGGRQGQAPGTGVHQRRHSGNESLPEIPRTKDERSPKRTSAPENVMARSIGHCGSVRNLDTGRLEACDRGNTMTPEFVFGKTVPSRTAAGRKDRERERGMERNNNSSMDAAGGTCI